MTIWMTSSTQTCRKCLIDKPLSAYHGDRRTANRKRTTCMECRSSQRRITNISRYEYAKLLVEQSNQCAICLTPATSFERSLSVDHDHATDTVRGLLCSQCNIGLGNFKDDVALLASAIVYLKKHNAA